MPHVINGIGTWYVGKRNLIRQSGICSLCGKAAYLSSYDTLKAFVLFFVPIIPLGRLRILEECSACRRHQALPLATWEEARRRALDDAIQMARTASGQPATIVEAIEVAMAFHDSAVFHEIATIVKPVAQDQPDVLLALANGHAMFGDADAGLAALRRAVKLRPDEGAKEQLATRCFAHGVVDEGLSLIDHVFRNHDPTKQGLAFLAIEALQHHARHEEAERLLDRIATAIPGAEQSRDFRRYRKSVRKGLKSGSPIRSNLVNRGAQAPVKPRTTVFSPWIVGPGLLAAAALFFLTYACFTGRNHDVYLVSGLSVPCTVTIDDRSYQAFPMQPELVSVPNGEVTIRVTAPGVRVTEQTVNFHQDWLKKPFNARTRILNPDGLAPLLIESTEYVPEGTLRDSNYYNSILVGEIYYELDDVDYPFAAFPATQRLPGGNSVTKKRIDLLPEHGVFHRLQWVANVRGNETIVPLIEKGAQIDPYETAYFLLLRNIRDTAQTLQFLEPLLSVRPALIDVHRIWQEIQMRSMSDEELAAVYQRLVDADPDDPGLQYLLARTLPPSRADEAERIYRHVKSDPIAGRYACAALGFGMLVRGQFEEALAAAMSAPEGTVNQMNLSHIILTAMHGLGRFGDCRSMTSSLIQNQTVPVFDYFDELYFAHHELGRAAATEVLNHVMNEATRAGGKDDWPSFIQKRGEALFSYCEGDSAPLKAFAREGQERDAVWLISAGLYNQALEDAASSGSLANDCKPLLVALDAEWTQHAKTAARQFEAAISRLSAGTSDQRRVAAWLSGTAKPRAGEITGLVSDIHQKRLFLAALAVKVPGLRAECVPLLQRLNFDRRPPYLLYQQICEQYGTTVPAEKPIAGRG